MRHRRNGWRKKKFAPTLPAGDQTGGTMERELWAALYRMLRRLAATRRRRKRTRVGDAVIVAVYLWAAVHDRPVVWATRRGNWPKDLLDFELPAQSTMSRRLRTDGAREMMAALHEPLCGGADPRATLVKVMDAKPLPVGAYSIAKDARWGRGVRGQVRGYKLHALYGAGPLPVAWEVVPMNASEQRVAKRLLSHLAAGGAPCGGYVLADSVYDINDLYARAADCGHQLLAPRKRPDAGLGHRRHHPGRLRAIALLEGPDPRFGRSLYALRGSIERRFGRLTNFGGGLAPLPNWVRTLPRVRLWVAAKLLIAAARYRLNTRLAA
jgi:hypothetical protein